MKIMTVFIVIGKYLFLCVIYFNSSKNVRGRRKYLGAEMISMENCQMTFTPSNFYTFFRTSQTSYCNINLNRDFKRSEI